MTRVLAAHVEQAFERTGTPLGDWREFRRGMRETLAPAPLSDGELIALVLHGDVLLDLLTPAEVERIGRLLPLPALRECYAPTVALRGSHD